MEQPSQESASATGPKPRRSPTALPGWGAALITGVAVVALALGVILQLEVEAIQSSESGLSSRQLFGGTVSVTQELAPGNSSYGYWGSASFPSATGNGNPLVMEIAFLENVGVPVTLEFVICSEVQICGARDGSLDLVSLTPQLSESTIMLEPATGFYQLDVLNLPAYADDSSLASFSVQVNVALLGQLEIHT